MMRLIALLMLLVCLVIPAAADEDDSFALTPHSDPTIRQQLTTEPLSEPDILVISADGDVTLGRDTRKTSDIFGDELARQNGDLSFPFRNVQQYFAYDDLTLVNFEGTLTNTQSATNNTFSFASPPEHVQALSLGSIEAVALENNHMMDHGEQGLLDTQETLRNAGVLFSGFGETAIHETKGVKIGMLSYQTFDGRYPKIYEAMPTAIQTLRDAGCQLVIVSYHWGEERVYTPNENQQKLGRATVDAGADLVLGHHSHCLQPIERYNGKYIVYSLGNFSFAGNIRPEDFDTLIFQQRYRIIDGGLVDEGIRIIPCSISTQSAKNDFTPTPYEEDKDITRVVEKLIKNGKKLPYGLAQYPLYWSHPPRIP